MAFLGQQLIDGKPVDEAIQYLLLRQTHHIGKIIGIFWSYWHKHWSFMVISCRENDLFVKLPTGIDCTSGHERLEPPGPAISLGGQVKVLGYPPEN